MTGGYNFEANGGRFEDELRIMKLRDMDALMGRNSWIPKKIPGIFVRGYLEGIIRSESAVPPGSAPGHRLFHPSENRRHRSNLQHADGSLGRRGATLLGGCSKDLPVLKTATRALVFVHNGVRQQTADKKSVTETWPIFNILGESEKWVGGCTPPVC